MASDVRAIIDAYAETGLRLNPSKCEIGCSNFDMLYEYPIFKEFKRVKKEDLSLLGAPVQKGKAFLKSVRYQDHRTQNGYRTAVFIAHTRRTPSFS